MTTELLQNFICQLFESNLSGEVTVAWQGGEPTLMGLDFFKRSIEHQKEFVRPGVKVINTIQTNGTLIDDEWAIFFKENNFLVGISLDGLQELHDSFRVGKANQSTFYKTMRGLSYLHKYGVEFNVLTTINAGNVLNGKGVYRFLRDECVAKYIQFIPIVERIHDSVISNRPNETEGSITAKQYGNFLIEVFEEWVRSDVANVFVQMFDIALASWYGESHGMCVFSPICGTALVMEHNGDIYSCDHFVEPAFKLGNIQVVRLSELLSSHRQLQFGNSKLDLLPA